MSSLTTPGSLAALPVSRRCKVPSSQILALGVNSTQQLTQASGKRTAICNVTLPICNVTQLSEAFSRSSLYARQSLLGDEHYQPGKRASPLQATRGRKRGVATGSPDDEGDDEDQRRKRKREAIDEVISQINNEFGKGTVMPLDADRVAGVKTFSTGVLPLDIALGGGWPRGRIVEVYGHESSGKTSLALYAIAQMQKLNEHVVLIDAEHALDIHYAENVVKVKTEGPDKLIVVQPNCGEEAIDIAERFIRSSQVGLIVVDSVSALIPRGELDGLVGEGRLGALAALMSLGLRRLSPVAAKVGCTVMFLNQIRNKIGAYGNPEITSGGVALKFHASVRVEMKVVERKKLAGEDIGFRCRARVVKSKVSVPYKAAEFDLMHGRGIMRESVMLDAAEQVGIVMRKGAYYYYNKEVFQGKEKTLMYLLENPEIADELEKAVMDGIKAKKNDGVPPEDEEEEERIPEDYDGSGSDTFLDDVDEYGK